MLVSHRSIAILTEWLFRTGWRVAAWIRWHCAIVVRLNRNIDNLGIRAGVIRRDAFNRLLVTWNIRNRRSKSLSWIVWIIVIRWRWRVWNWVAIRVYWNKASQFVIGNDGRWNRIVRRYLGACYMFNIRVVARDDWCWYSLIAVVLLSPSYLTSCFILFTSKRVVVLNAFRWRQVAGTLIFNNLASRLRNLRYDWRVGDLSVGTRVIRRYLSDRRRVPRDVWDWRRCGLGWITWIVAVGWHWRVWNYVAFRVNRYDAT